MLKNYRLNDPENKIYNQGFELRIKSQYIMMESREMGKAILLFSD